MELASRLPSLTGQCSPTSAEPPSSCSGALLSPAAWPFPHLLSRGWLWTGATA